MANDEQPPSGTNRGVPVRDTVPSVDVTTTLISNLSQARAADIYSRNVAFRYLENATTRPLLPLNVDAVVAAGPIFDRLYIHSQEQLPDQPLAPEIQAVRNQQVSNPPDGPYIIRYYPWSTGRSAPDIRGRFAGDLEGTDMQPVNATMAQGIRETFAEIAAQMPGRFRFVEVSDPSQADISFASVANPARPFGGVADFHTGGILLNAAEFSRPLWVGNRHIIRHEIGHALGLQHPFSRSSFGEATLDGRRSFADAATFLDTAMTYVDNDHLANGARVYPAGFMASDMQALATLYPVAADRRNGVFQTGALPGVLYNQDQGNISVNAGDGMERQVGLIREGMQLDIMPDTGNDILTVNTSVPSTRRVPRPSAPGVGLAGQRSTLGSTTGSSVIGGVVAAANGERTQNNGAGSAALPGYRPQPDDGMITQYTYPITSLRQVPNGILVGTAETGVTLVTTTPERIRLSPGSETVEVTSNTRIDAVANYMPPGNRVAARDEIRIFGSNNEVSLDGADFRNIALHIAQGTSNRLIITNADRLDPHGPAIPFIQHWGAGPVHVVSWRKDDEGRYQLGLSGTVSTTQITIELQPATADTQARFERALESSRVTSRESALLNDRVTYDYLDIVPEAEAARIPRTSYEDARATLFGEPPPEPRTQRSGNGGSFLDIARELGANASWAQPSQDQGSDRTQPPPRTQPRSPTNER